MLTFDQEPFVKALERHSRRCGKQPPAPSESAFYYTELKALPLAAILQALAAHEAAEHRVLMPATIAEITRQVARMRKEGELPSEGHSQQCLHTDDHGVRCGLAGLSIQETPGGWVAGFCRGHARFQPSFVALARAMPRAAVLKDRDMGGSMLAYLDSHQAPKAPPPPPRKPMAPIVERVLPPAPTVAEVLAAREPGADDDY